MPKVGIVMGSDSDMKVMSKAADMLEKFGIEYEMTIISAHREPDVFYEYAKSAEAKDFKVIIAGAGMAAHLPGMCAAIFPMPVIGVPMSGKNLEGMDALYSIVQMPPGIPVATVAIDGGANAAILAAKILATSNPELLQKLKDYTAEMKETVQKKAEKLEKLGHKEYLKQKEDHIKREESRINEYQQKYLAEHNIHCPYCNSTNVTKIGTVNRAVSVGMFGLASRKIGKQWHCNSCGSDF